jgi:hypothetical protein
MPDAEALRHLLHNGQELIGNRRHQQIWFTMAGAPLRPFAFGAHACTIAGAETSHQELADINK